MKGLGLGGADAIGLLGLRQRGFLLRRGAAGVAQLRRRGGISLDRSSEMDTAPR